MVKIKKKKYNRDLLFLYIDLRFIFKGLSFCDIGFLVNIVLNRYFFS